MYFCWCVCVLLTYTSTDCVYMQIYLIMRQGGTEGQYGSLKCTASGSFRLPTVFIHLDRHVQFIYNYTYTNIYMYIPVYIQVYLCVYETTCRCMCALQKHDGITAINCTRNRKNIANVMSALLLARKKTPKNASRKQMAFESTYGQKSIEQSEINKK